jgi:hypothetical protein
MNHPPPIMAATSACAIVADLQSKINNENRY